MDNILLEESFLSKIFRFCIGVLIISGSVLISSSSFLDDIANTLKISKQQQSINEKNIAITSDNNLIDVPLLNQMDPPRLKAGCEVTSLAMLLNFKGVMVSKNDLAQQIARVPFKYSNGYFGNPNSGFVGNMEDGPGLGVYHGPIFDLANKYVNGKVEDLTSQPFDLILQKVASGNPIWVINTKTFAPISDLQTWQTSQGAVDITYNMHSVVITGFDTENIYINNPYGFKNQKVNRENFIKAWDQMGKQAIVIY